ncbi:unnamed protein product, partial [marine sediment metagenome]
VIMAYHKSRPDLALNFGVSFMKVFIVLRPNTSL